MSSVMDTIRAAVSTPAPAESAEPAENQQRRGLRNPQLLAETCGKPAGPARNPQNPQLPADSETLAPPDFPHNPQNPQNPQGYFGKKEKTPAPTMEWLASQGCEALPGDIQFLRRMLPQATQRRNAILAAYVSAWLEAAQREPEQHRRQNKGRFTANTWLREGRLG